MLEQRQFEINLYQEMKEETHFHPELEILYILEGEAEIYLGDQNYRMKKEDILVVNSSIRHSVEGKEGSTVCSIKYAYRILLAVIKKSNGLFLCNSCADTENSYKIIRGLLQDLVCQEIIGSHKTECYKYSLFYQILDVLAEYYLADDSNPVALEYHDADEKLQRIIRYVHENYQDGISLSDIADEMYTSTSTLSRLFRKQTGIYFADYMKQIRVQYAVNELLYSEKNITMIAADCGFSNASVFTKAFREIHDVAPSEYRQQMRDRQEKEQRKKQEIRRELEKKLQLNPKLKQETGDGRNISAIDLELDVRNSEEYRKNWNQVINIGSIHNLTMANVQFHLEYLVRELGFTYARIWSVFSKHMMICDGKTIGRYNFDAIDGVTDFLVQNHIYVWLDFTRRPNANVKAVDDVLWYETDDVDFASRRAWEALFESFLKHIVARYGREEVEHWYFEIGDEVFHPEISRYYHDPEYSFVNVYQFFYRTLREIIPHAQIGLSIAPTNGMEASLMEQLKTCVHGGCQPDFVSFIMFPYVPHLGEERKQQKSFVRSTDKNYALNQIETMRQMMKRAGLESCKLYISEWNITVSTRNFLNDSCFRGAYICQKVAEMQDKVDLMGIWLGSDWISIYYDSFQVANGGGGLLTKDGIRKPAFFAINFLNRLGNRIISKGENYILTKRLSDSYVLLCFNVAWYSPSFFTKAENLQQPDMVEESFEKYQSLVLNFTLCGVSENATYIIKRRSINRAQGGILWEWQKLNFETRLERADVKYLQEICVPSLGMERLQAKKDKLIFSVPLESQEFTEYHIFPAE
jgi:beta-xylosidase/AraC-like DNA-binding protein